MNTRAYYALYKYHVPYKRTNDWYPTVWRELSGWCDTAFGTGHWEYFNENFMFETEEQKLLFKLRWL